MYDNIIKNFWFNIKKEVSTLIIQDSILSKFYFKNILQHKNFISSLSYILSKKISNNLLSFSSLRNLFEKIFVNNKLIIFSIIRDIKVIYNIDPVVDLFSTPLLYFKGFHALQMHRIGHYLWNNKRRSLALYLQNQVSMLYSIDIHPAARIGSGVFFDHANGIVIGETAVIDDDVSILQSVTLGSTGKTLGIRHPKICKGVIIGSGATVLGDINIGIGAKIGAGAVVLYSIPPYKTAVGIPAKVVN
ncbi:serine O-acetyltransferase [Buchnera aphidicola (Mollitrichosiphum nigrofasciatum)]|uniref:serine O-acetyltransferase n=1 Tax=Buchnera aphidicola TaxID=9 RepID=UPI0031B8347C